MNEGAGRRAKLFQNGRSQAVRLPVDMRFEGREVRIRRVGDAVILEPLLSEQAEEADAAAVPEGDAALDAVRSAVARLGPVDAEFEEMLRVSLAKLRS